MKVSFVDVSLESVVGGRIDRLPIFPRSTDSLPQPRFQPAPLVTSTEVRQVTAAIVRGVTIERQHNSIWHRGRFVVVGWLDGDYFVFTFMRLQLSRRTHNRSQHRCYNHFQRSRMDKSLFTNRESKR